MSVVKRRAISESGAMAGRNLSWKKRCALHAMKRPRVRSASASGMPEVVQEDGQLPVLRRNGKLGEEAGEHHAPRKAATLRATVW